MPFGARSRACKEDVATLQLVLAYFGQDCGKGLLGNRPSAVIEPERAEELLETDQSSTWSARQRRAENQMSSILFGDTTVPKIEFDYILFLGYRIVYKVYKLTGFNHQEDATQIERNIELDMETVFAYGFTATILNNWGPESCKGF